jgi:hypothetical protein
MPDFMSNLGADLGSSIESISMEIPSLIYQ